MAVNEQGLDKLVKQVDAGQLQRAYFIAKNLQKPEAEALNSALLAAREGKPVTVDPLLIEKGKSSGFLTGDHVRALTEARMRDTFAPHQGTQAFTLQPPTGNNTLAPKMDKETTVGQALDFAFSNSLGVANHMDLAASLVTAREGVVLSAYNDPAKGAGMNIGAGYNLKGNAKTVDADLRSIGVPAERLADVKEGRAALTGDQVKALTKLTLKRVEPEVIKTAERTKPGLWASLTAQQKAVMLDVAYQTGDASQYTKGWAALAAGNGEAFKAELKTYYTNRKGERVEDARALDLRSTLLQGPSAWKARLKVASK
jgi:GH24 family phage-related lysozyme (muramidase)